MRARYYDPTTGSFTSVDPLESLTNARYGYAGDDPSNAVDGSGLACTSMYDPFCPLETSVNSVSSQLTNDVSTAGRLTTDLVALVPYGDYYASYEAANGINAVGSAFGPYGSDAAHVIATPLVIPEAFGLGGDIAIDEFKGAVFGDESIYDEGAPGYINPFHSALPDWLKGPQTYLPGLGKDQCGNTHVNFAW